MSTDQHAPPSASAPPGTRGAGPRRVHGGQAVPGRGVHDPERYRAAGWWSERSVLQRYADAVTLRPDGLAVVDDRGVRLTHRELWAAGGRLAAELGRGGVAARHVVLVDLPNRVEWQVAVLGCLRAGAVPATLPVTTDADTVGYLVDAVAPRVVVTARTRGLADTVLDAVSRSSQAPGVLCVDDPDAGAGSWAGVRWLVRPTAGAVGWRAPVGVDHLMFTSSTTGRPKSVVHSEETLGAVNAAFAERFGLTAADPLFMPSPLGHSVGAWHGSRLALWNGAPLVLQDRWDPELAARLLGEYGCAFTAAATPFLTDLVHTGGFGALRTFLCGGAAVPPSLVEAAEQASPGTLFSVLWGMTEGGVTTCLRTSPRDKRAHTAGLPLPGLELCVVDGGELAMRGPGVCVGYLGQEDLFAELVTDDGFFRTGDLASIDDDGYLRVTGRSKDLIIRGGVNVSPLPTEDALAAHPHVRSVAVIGVPDERLGERIGAVVCTDGETVTLDEMCAWLDGQRLPRRQWPERLFVVDEMPRTAAGKIRKNVLREQLTGGGR